MWEIAGQYESSPGKLGRGDLAALDETTFRGRFAELVYSRMTKALYSCVLKKEAPAEAMLAEAEEFYELWSEKGLDPACTMLADGKRVFGLLRDCLEGKDVDLSGFKQQEITEKDREVMLHVIHSRRSVRQFKKEPVPDEIINKVLEAALAANHTANLGSIRFLVINESVKPWVFRGSDIPPAPYHIAVLQDDRPYLNGSNDSLINRIIDAGAATDNLLLAIYAYGLDGVWLTYQDFQIDEIRKRFELPDYIRIVDFVDFGWGDQTPFPPQRPSAAERTIVRV